MRHRQDIVTIGGRTCTVLAEPDGRGGRLVVQPTDSHDREEMDKEIEYVEAHTLEPFTLVAVHVDRWFDELSPWPAPPVFGKTPFGDGAAATLNFICNSIIPYITQHYNAEIANGDNKGTFSNVIIGGYSLAGLFALWAGCQCAFGGIVAASPSVWFPGWTDYARKHPSLARRVYLSLGDRETHTKTKIMSTVGDRLNDERDLLSAQGVSVTLEMNPGNHFQDNGMRMGKGIATLL